MPADIREQTVLDLCRKTAEKLVDLDVVPPESEATSPPPRRTSKLLLPRGRDGKPRLSEQEARQLLCHEVAASDTGVRYVIERPTRLRYRFRGGGGALKVPVVYPAGSKVGQSAMSDVSLYLHDGERLRRRVDIEFKEGNVEKAHLAKDFLKLVAEAPAGLFIHVLSEIDNGTLTAKGGTRRGVLVKYADAMSEILEPSHWQGQGRLEDQPEGFGLMFAVCVVSLQQAHRGRVMLTKVLTWSKIGEARQARLREGRAQVWMTGTELAPFDAIRGEAAVWRVAGGGVERL